jgi:hypothetical protein
MRLNALYQHSKLIRRSLLALYVITALTAVITAGLVGRGATCNAQHPIDFVHLVLIVLVAVAAHPRPGMTVCTYTSKDRYLWIPV